MHNSWEPPDCLQAAPKVATTEGPDEAVGTPTPVVVVRTNHTASGFWSTARRCAPKRPGPGDWPSDRCVRSYRDVSIFARMGPQRRRVLLRGAALIALVALVLGAGASASPQSGGRAAAPTSASAPSATSPRSPHPRPRTPVAIPPTADVNEAWSIIGNAIVEDDTATFREYSTPETYNLVVRPRDINGSQDVLLVSHWNTIGDHGRSIFDNFIGSSVTIFP